MFNLDDIVNSSIGGIGRVTDVIGKHICVKFASGNSMYHTADELQPAMCIVENDGHEYVCQVLDIFSDGFDVLWNGQAYFVEDVTRFGKWNEFPASMAYADFVRVSVLVAELA